MPAPDAEFGERIIQLPLPFIAATARLDRDQAGREPAELREVGSLETFSVSTLSIGTVNPNCPVAGSVTSAELTLSALRCSGLDESNSPPPGSRTTPGSSASASVTVAGRLGSSLAVCAGNSFGAQAPCSTEVTVPRT